MSTNDLVEGEALLDEEENDVEYDEETGEVNEDDAGVAAGAYDDSSEEDEDLDDDEEAAREVRLRPSTRRPLCHPRVLFLSADTAIDPRRLYRR